MSVYRIYTDWKLFRWTESISLSTWLNRFQFNGFPVGTIVVNCLGSIFLGVVLSYGIVIEGHFNREALIEIGLGGMTTFSTYALESYDLIQKE